MEPALVRTNDRILASKCRSRTSLRSEPEWLLDKVLAKWGQVAISYIRYETMLPLVREALASVDAKAIGRRGEDGAPNLDHLLGELGHRRKPAHRGQWMKSQSHHTERPANRE